MNKSTRLRELGHIERELIEIDDELAVRRLEVAKLEALEPQNKATLVLRQRIEDQARRRDELRARVTVLLKRERIAVMDRHDDSIRQSVPQPTLRGLVRFADFFTLRTRKQIKALAGDYHEEIRRLQREKRPIAAGWNVWLAWWESAKLVIRSPINGLIGYLRKSILG